MIPFILILSTIQLSSAASVCIDAGHGGHDPGAVGNGLVESDLNLTTALAFRAWAQLDNTDGNGGGSWDVYMTRTSDASVGLSERTDYANSIGVDVFMCIHTNAGGGNGTETFAYAPGGDGERVAELVQDEVLDHLGTYDRGVKFEEFYVLVYTSMPAELNEMAFIDVWSDNAELLADPANLDDVGLANLHALQRYFGYSAYTPTDDPVDPGDPTASLSFSGFPTEVDSGAAISTEISYETDLYEFGEYGQIAVDMKDAETWDVLSHVVWDNDGNGIQGPSNVHSFDFTAPAADVTQVCFVGYLSPLGGDYDNRLADASTCSTPTEIVYDPGKEPPTGHSLSLEDVPESIGVGEEFTVGVVHEGSVGNCVMMVALVESGSGRIVDTRTEEGTCDDETARHDFTLSYEGGLGRVWVNACMKGTDRDRCIAQVDNEEDPIQVLSIDRPEMNKETMGCGCQSSAAPMALWGVLAALGAMVGRRSAPRRSAHPLSRIL